MQGNKYGAYEAIRGYVNEKNRIFGSFLMKVRLLMWRLKRIKSSSKRMFSFEVNITFSGSNFFSKVRNADLYAAIDEVRKNCTEK